MLREDKPTGCTAQMNSFCSLKGNYSTRNAAGSTQSLDVLLVTQPCGISWLRLDSSPGHPRGRGWSRLILCFSLFLCVYTVYVCVVSNRADLCPRSTAGGRRRTLFMVPSLKTPISQSSLLYRSCQSEGCSVSQVKAKIKLRFPYRFYL